MTTGEILNWTERNAQGVMAPILIKTKTVSFHLLHNFIVDFLRFPTDYFLWEYVKNEIYKSRYRDIDILVLNSVQTLRYRVQQFSKY